MDVELKCLKKNWGQILVGDQSLLTSRFNTELSFFKNLRIKTQILIYLVIYFEKEWYQILN